MSETIVLDKPDQIAFARLCALKAMLKLEILGLRRRGRSAYSLLKDLGYKGSRMKVLKAVQNDVDAKLGGKEGKALCE